MTRRVGLPEYLHVPVVLPDLSTTGALGREGLSSIKRITNSAQFSHFSVVALSWGTPKQTPNHYSPDWEWCP